ncbi:MAG: RNA polymerase sigma factor [Lachnospiraceae bacterium]|nr:RNA polymerase sigma factor [Lachnospiraceae bacterium]
MNKDEGIRLNAEEVLKEYSNMVFRLAFARVGNVSDAQDVMQEVFLKYMQYKKTFKDKEQLKAWLIRVTINTAPNMVTSAWHRHTTGLEEADAAELPASLTTATNTTATVTWNIAKAQEAVNYYGRTLVGFRLSYWSLEQNKDVVVTTVAPTVNTYTFRKMAGLFQCKRVSGKPI